MSRLEGHNQQSWRARAAYCRQLAATFPDSSVSRKLRVLADDYERRAEAAELIDATPRSGLVADGGMRS